MKVILFNQWDGLLAVVKANAESAALEKTSYELVRHTPSDGGVTLKDRAMNALAVNGGEVTVRMPDITPGKARDFLLRLEAEADTAVTFTGAEIFEADNPDALMSPAAGETVIYFFTETAGDVFLVARRRISKLET